MSDTAVQAWLVGAMLAQGALALALLVYLGTIRLPMVMKGEVRVEDIALSRGGWPEREWQASNAFDNQFQLPVLFYVAGFVAIFEGPILLDMLLGWAFVATRVVHAFIHVTSNHVVHRFTAYVAGLAILCIFWLELVVRLVVIAFLFGGN